MTFTTSGLWLLLSPFLLLGGQSALSNAVIGEAGTLMILGLLALFVAGYSFNRNELVRAYLGLVLGLFVFAAPWIVEFAETVATWNARIVGTILALIALNQYKSEESF
ncbi:SPW repeat protein [Roseovarius sp. CAU 1744]|uniref:SPW repeat protein n=1 Tax=Roseovarius sp. CAU 1744 TaxID=3140368 RepID=UPI00325ABCDE